MASRSKKIKISPSVIGWMVVVLFTGAGLFFFSRHIIHFVKTSEYFTVKEIWYESSLKFMETNEIKGLKGKNIFDVDLSRAERQLQARYPQFAQLRILRRFPNQVLVVARERMPFARIQSAGKTATVDEKGVILSVNGGSDDNLPLVVGASLAQNHLASGTQIPNQEVKLALSIVKYFRMERGLVSYRISKIDVGNLSQVSFYVLDGLKIIVDQERLLHQLRMLSLVLSQAKIDAQNVKYIDLRFKEPILGKK